MEYDEKYPSRNPYPRADERETEYLKQEWKKDAQEMLDYVLHGGMAGVYLGEGLPVYFVGEPLLHEMKMDLMQFTKLYNGRYLDTIHQEEQGSYYEELKASVQQGVFFEKVCRVKLSDEYCYMRDIGKRVQLPNGTDGVLLLRVNVTDIKAYHQALKKKALLYEEKVKDLETLTANIPGGVCIASVDQNFTIHYGNAGFYTQIGYTKEQFYEEKQNCMGRLIYEKDLESVKSVLKDAISNGRIDVQFEHRIVQRDKTIIWVLVKGQFSYEKRHPELRCLVMDITDRKKIEEEAKISEERFRIALAQTDNTIFEYDIESRVMLHGDRSAESYGLKQYTENVPDSLVENGVIHPDCADDFLSMYQEIRTGSRNASSLVLAKLKSGGYVWRKIIMTAIFDEFGNPVQAVGILEDVDEQIRREAELRRQMEKDILTGLYNRGAFIAKAKQKMERWKEGSIQSLLVLDIDNFKGVNDQYGHVFGDYVLSQSAERITEILLEDNFAGRIGGDEYVVFLSMLHTKEEAVQWAERIVKCFQQPFCDRGMDVFVTCSIGVGIAPYDGQTFEALYQNADSALYAAKRAGKNGVAVYSPVSVLETDSSKMASS